LLTKKTFKNLINDRENFLNAFMYSLSSMNLFNLLNLWFYFLNLCPEVAN
jgi:hypothetical protein